MSRFMLWSLVTSVKALLMKELGLTRHPIMLVTSQEQDYSENYVKWSGHLPRRIVRDSNPDVLVQEACLTPTVVVVGDIRRSQDLMTYSRTAESFSIRMVEFITQTRLLLDKRSGFFDKFTGDGFLAYFNEAICRESGTNYLECFLEFLHDLREFSSAHFADWTREVKKLPERPVGLAIGADLGIVSFQNLNHHLVAVGDAIVWASRMASCANANETVVNNLLFEALRNTAGVQFQEREGKTKSGEGFLARVLLLPEAKSIQ